MSRKSKIDPVLKVDLVERYLRNEIGVVEAARLAGLSSHKSFSTWVSIYRNEGPSGLLDQDYNKNYPKELKLAAVTAYKNGEGSLSQLTERFGLRSKRQLRDWLKEYNTHGAIQSRTSGGGSYMRKARSTTPDERLTIVQDCLANDKNYGAMALKYQCSYQQVRNWVKRYEEMGSAGLEDRRGHRAGTMPSRTPEEEMRDRNEHVFPGVLYLGFCTSFFVTGIRVHEDRLKSVVFLETEKPFRCFTPAAADDLCDDRFRVIKPDLGRDTADMFKYRTHGFQQAFHVFSVMQLQVSAVAVREVKHEIFSRVSDAVFNKVGSSEISLRLARVMVQRDIPFLADKFQFLFLFRNIQGDQPVRAVEPLNFFFESPVDPFRCVPLLARGGFVFFEPAVDHLFVRVEFGTKLRLCRHGIRIIEVILVHIFTDRFPVKTGHPGDLRYTVSLLIEELSDTMYLIHC